MVGCNDRGAGKAGGSTANRALPAAKRVIDVADDGGAKLLKRNAGGWPVAWLRSARDARDKSR